MMKDWTDIIGEELENIEEPLPADDWSVLQQKYAASRKRRRAAAFAWAGSITSVAAAIALVLLLTRPDSSTSPLVADSSPVIPDPTTVIPDPTTVIPDPIGDPTTPETTVPGPSPVIPAPTTVIPDPIGDPTTDQTGDLLAEATTPETTDETFDVIRDTTLRDRLLADASPAGKTETKPEETAESSETYRFEDFPEDEPVRKKRLISIGVSRATSDSPVFGVYDMIIPNEPGLDNDQLPPINEHPDPADTAGTVSPQSARAMMRGKTAYTDSYDHDIPVSFGLSARFRLTDRISFNTGVNYTRYTSTRNRRFTGTSERQTDKQNVHYLGIPVRFDWAAVNRKHFNFYLGAGMQMDKCVYAKVGDERLYEKPVLFGLSGNMGLQFNITQRVGLYFEPEAYFALNDGTIETFRSDEPFVLTARGGLRLNF